MTAKVITVTSGKGGVGKTTTTANLGIALARLGKKIVVIDATGTITDAETLWAQIHEIRIRRFAVNDGEHYEEVAAVARHATQAPIPIWSSR